MPFRTLSAFVPRPGGVRTVWLLAAAWSCIVLAGCRSRPHQDLYVDQMASEVRVLEDQLYEADYENKVLRSKLQRAVENCDPDQARGIQPTPDPQTDWGVADVLPSEPRDQRSPSDSSDDLPDSAAGTPGATLLPPPGGLPGDDPRDLEDRRIETPADPRVRPRESDLIPPDLDSLELPDIDMGDIVPPPGPNEPPEPPLGRIPMPDLNPPALPEPAGLTINPTFSGGHNFDSDPAIDGVYLVVQFVDDKGKIVDLSDVDIDAELAVELVDPDAEPSEKTIGTWKFSAAEIAAMRRNSVQDGIHVAIRWTDTSPTGDRVMAKVRVFNEDTSLDGQSEVKLVGKGQIAGWVPRAGDRPPKQR
ncbi:hypothetical protein [Roseimaritima ulvae]|uniref:Uncharacterized protein n=1 Tax=Roseimaritima ulvae TaxID=980254 RepID=A0A5B9R109_9BACT|nr:hypothetical protein [Roseimaritima ulvae]QEG39973.1 hypothetical protein UC8_19760 [Roseimaritima ulvae]